MAIHRLPRGQCAAEVGNIRVGKTVSKHVMAMTRWFHLCVLGILVIVSSGCTAVRAWRFAHGMKLITVNPETVVYKGCGPDGYRFEVGLEFENLSDGEATLRDVQVTGFLDDKAVVSTKREEVLHIGPGGVRQLVVPVVVNPVHAARGILEGYKTVGFSGGVVADLGVLGERTFSFTSVHEIGNLREPRFALEKISLGDSGITAVRLRAVLRRLSDNDTSLKAVSLHGEVLINDRTVGQLDCETQSVLPDMFTVDIAFSTIDAIWVTANSVNTKRVDVEIRAILGAESDSLQLEIPYRFVQKDVLGMGNDPE